MAEHFSNRAKKCRASNKMNPKRPTPKYMIIGCQKLKTKRRILKAAREK